MIKPKVLESDRPYGPWNCRASDVWEILVAAERGDDDGLRKLLEQDPNLYRAEYWYTQPIYFAVREGHLDAVRLLLEAGADPTFVGLSGDDLVTVARDRGHLDVARLLEEDRWQCPSELQDDDRFEPIDAALWTGPFWGLRGDADSARRLLDSKLEDDLTIAAALGEVERVRAILDQDPERISDARPCGKRPLSSAVEFGHRDVVRLLLDRGADPNWPEGPTAPRGVALHAAARAGDRPMVELLLAHGGDPNAYIDSSGSATFAARTPGLRALLVEHGGNLDPYDLVWLDEADEAVRRVTSEKCSADRGCGGVLAAACKLGKRDLLIRLLETGVRVPSVLTECRSYLWCDPELLGLLLDSGMDPDLPDWQRATPLHDLCSRDSRGRPRPHRQECAEILLDAGASISSRDEDYRSTPLAWAARNDLPEMAELLLARGAVTQLPDDEPWATPLAWARRRGHDRLIEMIRAGHEPDREDDRP